MGPFKGPQSYSPGGGGRNLHNSYRPQSFFSLIWPTPTRRISQKFNSDPNDRHDGLDLPGPHGTPIFTAHEGVVVYSGNEFSHYGRMIIVAYDKKWSTLYAHLSRSRVKAGQSLKQGEILGFMGRTGRSTGVHLHFELLKNQIPVNPLPYLRGKKLLPSPPMYTQSH